ncbi:hypothetical protein SEA_DARBY_40 [Arthrobacter phage Darby]|uniref:Uncharacterized protein n=2 Tax=Gordonvirus TaxID=1982152 RepID=A0A9E7SWT1_9CAUD|nr:hypothetical protein FDH69_gp40 [Arthrobacter phage Gordon]YP_010750491.1 hypothetical protein QCN39_gp40 [Arthrobacter phage Darby]ALY09015.1 hypothetical protein GORDON_40 [Arthrobacter phage Gordon]UTN92045.1 hypothetical protein SEA_DARBY_40 [Arthrobacter phage Darby]
MFNALKTAIVANQDTIVRRSLGLGSIAAGMAINSMLNKPKATTNVVVVEEQTVIVEESNNDEPVTEEVK